MAQDAEGGGRVTVPREIVNCLDVALRDVVVGHGGDRLVVRLSNLRNLFQLL